MDQSTSVFSNVSENKEQKIIIIKELEKKERIAKFSILALPTLIYALLTTFFLYKNYNSIMTFFFTVATVIYLRVVLNKLSIEIKKGFNMYCIDIILFGIADMITDNGIIVFFNNTAIFVLIICMLLYTTYDQQTWGIEKYVGSFFTSIVSAIGCFGDFFSDIIAAASEAKSKKARTGIYCLLGVALFIPIALIIVPLLSSADAVFGEIVNDFFNALWSVDAIILIPLFFVWIYLFTYGGIRFLEKREIKVTQEEYSRWSAVIANTILFLINVLYILFSGIQIFSLFLGKMELPESYTYAKYAREGFFQLMFVCFLNLCIVLYTKKRFEKSTVTNILLCILSACTYIMLASSAMRLCMYIKVYNLTILRLEVILALIIMAISLAIIIISIFNNKINLIHTLARVVLIGMLVLTFIRPDAVVAKYNLAHSEAKIDYNYLQNLSADAAPYMDNGPGMHWEACRASYFKNLNLDTYSWREFNISRYIASKYE